MTNHTIAVIIGIYWIVQLALFAADDQPKANHTSAWFLRCVLALLTLPLFLILIFRLVF